MIQEAMLFRELSSKEQQQQAEGSKPKKPNKKDKKKKRKRDSASSSAEPRGIIVVDDDDQSPNNHKEEPQQPPSDDDDKTPKDSSSNKDTKQTRAERKARKQTLKDQLPKVDEHGIAYTKQQLRKMLKRVQRGLSPIPTPQEAHELRVQEAQLKKQEELELADMLYDTNTRNDDMTNNEDEDEDDDEDDHDDDEGEKKSEHDDTGDDQPMDHNDDHDLSPPPPAKRVKPSSSSSKKPVPSDYVCQACHNRHQPAHWIYHCPDKVTMRGSNHVSASKQQHHDGMPSAKKVFVSGLPFDATPKTVKELLGGNNDQHKVTSVQLLKFPDTGRCKGQAFVCFDSEAGAHAALTMSGTKLEHSSTAPDTKKKSVTPEPTPKKELVLKVSKVQSRYITKQRKQQPHH